MPLGVYLLSSDNQEINVATELLAASFINAFNVWLLTTGDSLLRACFVCPCECKLMRAQAVCISAAACIVWMPIWAGVFTRAWTMLSCVYLSSWPCRHVLIHGIMLVCMWVDICVIICVHRSVLKHACVYVCVCTCTHVHTPKDICPVCTLHLELSMWR